MAISLNTLPQRAFSTAGKSVSILGLGTVKFGRNEGVKYPGGDGFALPTDQHIHEILDLCIEKGISLIDTAPAYGTSEARIGSLLGARREKFFICTKTGEEFNRGKSEYIFTAEHTRMSIERSLTRLKTDYLDCVLVHSSRDDLNVINNTPVLETLAKFKEQGKIRSFGISTYTIEGGKRAVDLCDAVMVAYNKNYIDEKPVIDYAHQQGKAVLIKKGLASGHINTPESVANNIRFILGTTGVTSLIIGNLTLANIQANITAAQSL